MRVNKTELPVNRTGRNLTGNRSSQRGFTLIAAAFSIIMLVGMVALALDLGRIYIAKAEMQNFTDSASLAATLELDGTMTGISRALAQVASNPNRWNFMNSTVANPQTSFAETETGPWVTNPATASRLRLARVTASADIPLLFLGVFLGTQKAVGNTPTALLVLQNTQQVKGDSAAGQEPKDSWNQGLFPFSPYAHSSTGPYFGLTVGQKYTLRWPASPKASNVCPGDTDDATIALAGMDGGSERGFIESTSSSIIRDTIVADYQSVTRTVGDSVTMTGGAKQTQLTSLVERINQDGDKDSATYSAYIASGRATGRRLVGAPINTGYPDYKIVQIGAFFLLPTSEYDAGGNKAFCAEFIGAWVQGSRNRGAGDPGAYVARLIQ